MTTEPKAAPMSIEATRAPWQVGNFNPRAIFDCDELGPVKVATAKRLADARRIVACANALELVPTQTIEKHGNLIRNYEAFMIQAKNWEAATVRAQDKTAEARSERDALRAQVAELRTALQAVVYNATDDDGKPFLALGGTVVSIARAALAKVPK